jgi:hypothetical protein
LKTGKTGPIWVMLVTLTVTLVPAAIVTYLGYSIQGYTPSKSAIFFYENFAPLLDEFVPEVQKPIHLRWFWFLHVYFQCFCAVAILLSANAFRRWLRSDIWRGSLIVFGVAELVSTATVLFVATQAGSIASAAHMLRWTPTSIMPLLVIGMLVGIADNSAKRLIVVGLALGHVGLIGSGLADGLIELGQTGWQQTGWQISIWLAAVAFLAAFPYLRIPGFLANAFVRISAAALMIYLSHTPLKGTIEKIVGVSVPDLPGLPMILLLLAAGVLLWELYRPLLERLGINRLGKAPSKGA